MPTKQQDDVDKASAIAAYEAWVKGNSTGAVQVELAKRDILRKSGFTVYTTEPVMETLDNGAMKEGVWRVTSDEAIVVTQKDRDTLPLHRLTLGSRLLDGPAHGTDEWFDQDVLVRSGWLKAEQAIWKLIDHKFGSTLQRWTRERLPDHVFVRTADSVFITPEAKFAAQEIYGPEDDKLELLAVAIGTQRALFETQLHALKGQGTSLATLGSRVSKRARGAYDAKAALNNGNGDKE